jgi:hypothetical protein
MISTSRSPAVDTGERATTKQVRQAILRALAYSDIFDDPPERSSLYRALELPNISLPQFDRVLEIMQGEGTIILDEDRCMLAGREALAPVWRRRAKQSAQKWQIARRYAALIRCLPYIRMIAVTGSLAAQSAEASDDIDLFLITAPGRVWLARALTILVVRLAALFNVTLCPNYLIATDALELTERNLYSARELVQMQPLYGAAWYRRLRICNRWALEYLPNAEIDAFTPVLPLDRLPIVAYLLKWMGERLLNGKLGTALQSKQAAS